MFPEPNLLNVSDSTYYESRTHFEAWQLWLPIH